MLVTAIIKNTRLTVGVCSGGGVIFSCSFAADPHRTADEYAMLIELAFARKGIPLSCEGVIIGSVFPPLTDTLKTALTSLFNAAPLIVGPGVKCGLDIRIEQHTQLGADIVANAAGAQRLVSPPYAVIDFDDATTLTAINTRGELCGVIIAAGAGASVRALAEAAELPLIELHIPDALLGRNTEGSINSGVLFGCAAMCDGLIERLRGELVGEQTGMALSVAATGQYAPLILPLMKTKSSFDADLTLEGLAAIYENDRKKRKPASAN